MNGDRFEAYVRLQLVPVLRPGQIVILDNLAAHKRASVRTLVEAAGCELRFLPAYSPDLNPIELAFAKLKALLRADEYRDVPTLIRFLNSAKSLFRPAECRNFMRHDGYAQPAATP